MSDIVSVATALPRHRYSQEEIKELCRPLFPRSMSGPSREAVFDHAGVRTRYLVEGKDYYLSRNGFAAKNRDYLKHALLLAGRAISDCLKRAGGSPQEGFASVSHFFSVTTTGLLTPSLEAHLAQTMPFRRSVKRTPVFGVGCAGGAVGLARAHEYLKGHPTETVLLLSVELCSLTFQPQDDSMTQLVAAALFGDGAAAALLRGGGAAAGSFPRILDCASLLLPDSLGVMGWDFSGDGMRLVLSPDAPRLIGRHFAPAVEAFLAGHGLSPADIGVYLLHPGSAKIIDAYESALGLRERDTLPSRRFLEEHGNLSSASILFMLAETQERDRPAPGSYGLLAALGPGFSCELTLLRFP